MGTSTASSNGGIGLGGLLLVLFIALKLTHVITWSWLWVLAPLWLPLAMLTVFILIWFIWMLTAGKDAFR